MSFHDTDNLLSSVENITHIDTQTRKTKKLWQFYAKKIRDNKAKKRITKQMNQTYSNRVHTDTGKKQKQSLQNTLNRMARNQER